MPYAAKSIVQHEFDTDHLNVWVEFRLPMNQLVMPLLNKWVLCVDDVTKTVSVSAWQDEYTLLLTVPNIASSPNRVLLSYLGPGPITYLPDDPDRKTLETTWQKQWQPFGPILSLEGWPTTFKYGMIILWHGSIASIPTGWHLCDGTEDTPDLRGLFVNGASDVNPPGSIGGTYNHTHTKLLSGATTTLPAGSDIAAGTDFNKVSTSHTHALTIAAASNTPPYYALCYIMKL